MAMNVFKLIQQLACLTMLFGGVLIWGGYFGRGPFVDGTNIWRAMEFHELETIEALVRHRQATPFAAADEWAEIQAEILASVEKIRHFEVKRKFPWVEGPRVFAFGLIVFLIGFVVWRETKRPPKPSP